MQPCTDVVRAVPAPQVLIGVFPLSVTFVTSARSSHVGRSQLTDGRTGRVALSRRAASHRREGARRGQGVGDGALEYRDGAVMEAPGGTVRRSEVLSRGKARARGLMSVPLLILGLTQLVAFTLLTVFAASSAYFAFDVPVERWIQGQLGGTAPWLFGAVTALNGPRQTLVGFLLLLIVVILNPRTIVFAVLASLTGPIYFVVNSMVSRPRPSGQLVQVSEHLAGGSFPSGHATFAATY